MATPVSICSNALVMLGGDPFASMAEDHPHVRVAANLYDSARDSLLRTHSWNCCIKREILAPLEAAPPFDYAYQFLLPGDWLRTLQVGRLGQPLPYQSEGKRILADVNALPIVYVYRNTVESTWHAHLVRCLELCMAAEMAYHVTGSTSLRESFRDAFGRQLQMAKAIDGQDNPPEEFGAGFIYESRF